LSRGAGLFAEEMSSLIGMMQAELRRPPPMSEWHFLKLEMIVKLWYT